MKTVCASKLKQANKSEKDWGCSIISEETVQWTTKLTEDIVSQVIKTVYGCKLKKGAEGVDRESDTAFYEIKSRNWTTPGTIGEKILGSAYKYTHLPKKYGKPLYIVLTAFQEFECSHGPLNIFGKDISPEKQEILEKLQKLNIHFIPFTQILEKYQETVG